MKINLELDTYNKLNLLKKNDGYDSYTELIDELLSEYRRLQLIDRFSYV